jgi:hypothetical protein
MATIPLTQTGHNEDNLDTVTGQHLFGKIRADESRVPIRLPTPPGAEAETAPPGTPQARIDTPDEH